MAFNSKLAPQCNQVISSVTPSGMYSQHTPYLFAGQLVASTLGKTILTIDPIMDDAQHLQRAVKEMGIVETVQGLNENAKGLRSKVSSSTPNISLINGESLMLS